MSNEFKTAQEVINNGGGSAYAGFNRRVYGNSYSEAFRYDNERFNYEMQAGWNLADKMINDGKLFFVNRFHHLECNGGFAFPYGGTWVCNTCGRSNLDREWWRIKVMQDGDAWCCVGIGFENLQESDNYAFGDTRQEAIDNYGKLMVKKSAIAKAKA